MKKIVMIVSLLFVFLLSTVAQAKVQNKEVDYTILKHQSHDVSIANDYFNKPIVIEQQEGFYIISFSVNHSHWISEITLNGQPANEVKNDKQLADTVIYSFKLDKLSQEIPATIKVDIEEEISGDALSYHNKYPITFKINLTSQEINELNNQLNSNTYIIGVLIIGASLCSLLIYKLIRGRKKINEN